MQNNFFGSKLNTVLLVILIILMIIALRFMYKNKETYFPSLGQQKITTNNLNSYNPNQNTATNNEESIAEIFTNQPGAVKSIIDKSNGQWVLAVDILTPNQNWMPGVDSTGGFFLNQNTKIRNLDVTSSTKMYSCGTETRPDVLQNTSIFIQNIQKRIDDYNKLNGQQKSVSYVSYYFDINGSNISAIYEQCLP